MPMVSTLSAPLLNPVAIHTLSLIMLSISILGLLFLAYKYARPRPKLPKTPVDPVQDELFQNTINLLRKRAQNETNPKKIANFKETAKKLEIRKEENNLEAHLTPIEGEKIPYNAVIAAECPSPIRPTATTGILNNPISA